MAKGRLERGVSIIGAGYTDMGLWAETPEFAGLTERELLSWAAIEAMDDAGIASKDVDALVLGHCGPNFYSKSMSAGAHYTDWAGLHGKPAWFHDEACSTSMYGLEQAAMMVASGVYDCVLSVGIGINSTAPLASKPPYLRGPIDNDLLWEGMYYAVEAAYDKPGNAGVGEAEAAIMRYLVHYGYTLEQYDDMMCAYLQMQRKNALANPKARIIKQTFEEQAADMGVGTVDEFLHSDIFNPLVGSVLRSQYLGLACDGASAVIVCSDEVAPRLSGKKPIAITGMAASTNVIRDWGAYPMRESKGSNDAAMAMAGITGDDIDYMGIHDCTGSMIVCDCEQVGYLKPGEGITAAVEGRLAPDGDKPVNTSGGRMQMGHPSAGALGIEITEAVRQMRGENGSRQMPKAPKTSFISSYGAGFSMASLVLQSR